MTKEIWQFQNLTDTKLLVFDDKFNLHCKDSLMFGFENYKEWEEKVFNNEIINTQIFEYVREYTKSNGINWYFYFVVRNTWLGFMDEDNFKKYGEKNIRKILENKNTFVNRFESSSVLLLPITKDLNAVVLID